ncbi:hypothetical protein Q3V37_24450 [Micromonospora profundi]|uniref:DUF4352 domain-containing protein n=1 Tax=Micromonospora profundi TaxID=1420889 RepID=A0AAJ6HP69_9ACTN|nr:hypothetical protein [Micromonospora profundi]WLS44510.1 hypothetical protein Q3V37_24450 [Micromonospora profundi]
MPNRQEGFFTGLLILSIPVGLVIGFINWALHGFKDEPSWFEMPPSSSTPASPWSTALPAPTAATDVSTPSSGPSVSPAAPTTLKVGQTLLVSTGQGKMKITIESVKVRTTACNEYVGNPDSGYFIVAEVSVEVTEGKGNVHSTQFMWEDKDGNTDGGAYSGCGEPPSKAGSIKYFAEGAYSHGEPDGSWKVRP